MNIIRYLLSYITPSRYTLSMAIAVPLSQTMSPMIVGYYLGTTSVFTYPIVQSTSLLLLHPTTLATYYGSGLLLDRIRSVPKEIELTTFSPETTSQTE